MNRQETEKRVKVQCQGNLSRPNRMLGDSSLETGGILLPTFSFPNYRAARLMLALLEHCVSELGGAYAMEDTDSMAFVATEQGGTFPEKGENSSPKKVPRESEP